MSGSTSTSSRSTPPDRFTGRGRESPWIEHECLHRDVVPSIAPMFVVAIMKGAGSRKLRTACPECRRELAVRLWRSEAGGWYIGLQECFAAGRRWLFRYEDEQWIAAI